LKNLENKKKFREARNAKRKLGGFSDLEID